MYAVDVDLMKDDTKELEALREREEQSEITESFLSRTNRNKLQASFPSAEVVQVLERALVRVPERRGRG